MLRKEFPPCQRSKIGTIKWRIVGETSFSPERWYLRTPEEQWHWFNLSVLKRFLILSVCEFPKLWTVALMLLSELCSSRKIWRNFKPSQHGGVSTVQTPSCASQSLNAPRTLCLLCHVSHLWCVVSPAIVLLITPEFRVYSSPLLASFDRKGFGLNT